MVPLFPEFPIRGRYRTFTLRVQDILHLIFYAAAWGLLFLATSHDLLDPRTKTGVWIVGIFGLWRYSWWMLNLGRSQYYGHVLYPNLRRTADLWWRVSDRPHVHFMMTTFHEHPDTTQLCLEAIVKEIGAEQLRASLWIGVGAYEDEGVIEQWLATQPELDMDVTIVRQNRPGKRAAIGLILRALSRHGVQPSDIAVMLDGDSIITQGCLQKCLSVLGAFPSVQALTTDEDALCLGPLWMQKWLTMRFAQRRLWMQSHSMSRRVLTLTGRFSAFRAPVVVEEGFISLVEDDHLEHWFWGDFQFLSGDDKSTWYYLMKEQAEMLYLPDAMVYTIERVSGNGLKRTRDNILRWSGNLLRNGMRAILLGPGIVPPFIWWCLIDQRIVIVTTLAGFFTAMSVMLLVKFSFIFSYALWIMLTRLAMSSALFCYSDRIHISYPLILYFNQLSLAFAKAYLIFRLPQQRWANRMDQRSNENLMARAENRLFPLYQNVFYMTLLVLVLLLCIGVLRWPDFQEVFPVERI